MLTFTVSSTHLEGGLRVCVSHCATFSDREFPYVDSLPEVALFLLLVYNIFVSGGFDSRSILRITYVITLGLADR